jgi:two-component system, NtrC family, sensor kinase
MKKLTLTLFLALICSFGFAQKSKIDSLRNALNTATHDSIRLRSITKIYQYYEATNNDSTLFYGTKGLSLARKNKQSLYEGRFLVAQAAALRQKGDYAATLKNLLQAFEILQNPASEKNAYGLDNKTPAEFRLARLDFAHQVYGGLMEETGNTEQAIFHVKESIRIASLTQNYFRISAGLAAIANKYLDADQLDSVEVYAQKSLKFGEQINNNDRFKIWPFLILAGKNLKSKNDELGRKYLYQALQVATKYKEVNRTMLATVYRRLSEMHQEGGVNDSTLYYAKKAYEVASEPGLINTNLFRDGGVYEVLYKAYLLNNKMDSAFKYQGLTLTTRDAWNKEKYKNLAAFQSLLLSEATRLRELEKQQIETQSKIRTYAFLAVLAVFSIIGLFLYRNNRQKQKANKVLQRQRDEINDQRQQLQVSLETLKSTQAQLIQSEKLASLGELTAGIAHEIQNPLNFVNNFSELSSELIDEMNAEIDKGDTTEVKSIALDLKQNLEKITLHGQRASSIVKGMLEHSRTSTGEKELTDINQLADEYLRLAYHGLRAKDKSFNADFKTEFDENLLKINIIPQDIGRVFLNLINNAFYATKEKGKTDLTVLKTGEGNDKLLDLSSQLELKQELTTPYKPTVTVTTRSLDDKIEIKITDNGNGMSEEVKAKIFQPFFTTKPTGQGTGLGLSLAYDILKSHGGALKVESKEGKGTTFTIQLPK